MVKFLSWFYEKLKRVATETGFYEDDAILRNSVEQRQEEFARRLRTVEIRVGVLERRVLHEKNLRIGD